MIGKGGLESAVARVRPTAAPGVRNLSVESAPGALRLPGLRLLEGYGQFKLSGPDHGLDELRKEIGGRFARSASRKSEPPVVSVSGPPSNRKAASGRLFLCPPARAGWIGPHANLKTPCMGFFPRRMRFFTRHAGYFCRHAGFFGRRVRFSGRRVG